MNIEITKLAGGLTVLERVIRDVRELEDGTPHVAPRLQAALRHEGTSHPEYVLCDLMYYDQDGAFLGHDSWGEYARLEWRGNVYPLDMSLTIPAGAATARLSLSITQPRRFWPGVGKALVVLLLVLVLALIRKSVSP